MGLNRLPNPVLATDATGWAGVGWTRQASLTYPIGIGGVTTGARFYTTSSESAVYVALRGPLVAVEPGDTYTVSAYFCGVSATPLETRLSYVRYDALGEPIEYVLQSPASANHEQGVWKRLSKTFVVPAGTAYIGPLASAQKTAWNDVEMTCFQVEKGDLSDWNDGTVAWTASLLINDDDASTDDNDVVLTISALGSDGQPPDEMRFAEAPVGTDPGDVVWGSWEAYATTRAWQLAAQTDEAAHDVGVGVEFQRT